MKVNIWVHKNDIMSNKILTYHYTRPYHDRNDEYVQITISQDEFVQLEDREEIKETSNGEINTWAYWKKKHDALQEKYSVIDDEDENLFVDEEAMIDNSEIYSKAKDGKWLIEQYNRNRATEDHIDDVNDIPKDYSDEFNQKIKKARDVIDELQGFMKVTGGEFRQWFDSLSDRAKDIYKNEYKKKK
jgi:hypothetical protein